MKRAVVFAVLVVCAVLTVLFAGERRHDRLFEIRELSQLGPYRAGDPFGEFSTPVHGTTVSSSVPFTGWALDDKGIRDVKIYRLDGDALVYIDDAVFIEGARQDVETAYPGYPNNSSAGWGYMMLTNFLPGNGNGTFTFYAVATDTDGNSVTLGEKTVIIDNANAVKPFGAIDKPVQGGTASGTAFRVDGWVLTPSPSKIPEDGSTIQVVIDGKAVGTANYNVYRGDIAGLFPGYANSGGAKAYFDLDTTQYEDGLHTIQFTVTDNNGHTDGVGSRFFTVDNSPQEPADYYVSTSGNDANDGKTEATAFKTISKALNTVRPGETVLILGGTYYEGLIKENYGSAAGTITIKGVAGETILDGGRSVTMGFWFENTTNLSFENLEIRNYTDVGIGFYYCSNISVSNLVVHNNGFAVQLIDWEFEGYGIHIENSGNVLIDSNTVYQNGPNPQKPGLLMGTGINMYGCTDSTISNNSSYENTGGGYLIEDSVNVVFENNSAVGNDLDAWVEEWWDGGLWVDGGHDIIVRNNVFTGNLGPGIEISDEDYQSPYGYVLENNVCTGNYYGIYIWNFGTSGWPASSVIQRSGNTFSNNTRKDIWIQAWVRKKNF